MQVQVIHRKGGHDIDKEFRNPAKLLESDVKQWQVARKLNISESAMSRKLRVTLTEDERQEILKAISEISKNH